MTELAHYAQNIESLAQRLGLDYYPVDFEMAPQSLMTEIAVYGLPVRMPHWSFGVRYIHQLVRQSMGHSKIFEVVFPGDPCRAFLLDTNSMAENALVTAHVVGHADFSKNNQLFERFHQMAGGNIIEKAATHAHRIQQAIDAVGLEKVEAVLDAAGSADRPGAHARAAAPGIRPALVHRQLRARPRAMGARHLPRGARRIALFLPGVRLPDHERGLGVLLARAPAARGRLPAAGALPRGDQGALRRGAAARLGRADRAGDQSLSPRLHAVGAHRGEARPRARAPGDEGRGRLRLRAQLARPRSRR